MAEDMVGHPKPAVKREIISTCLLPGLMLANNRDIDLKSTVHVSVTFWSLIRLLEFKTHDFGNEKIAQHQQIHTFLLGFQALFSGFWLFNKCTRPGK